VPSPPTGRASDAAGPPSATETPRQTIARALTAASHSAYELSALARVPEKDVAAHLEHLARSLRRSGGRLDVEPARCRDCDYVFRERTRLTRPSACPRCRGQHLTAPVFRVVARPR
jgi:transcriptional regulator